ncbi:MAG: DUF2628 domain-containing protein [Aestuariivirgaceae bacterium]
MKIFTAHRPPQASHEDAVFIKEGFSWPAFFFSVIWLVLKRLWFPLILYLLALALIFALAARLSLPDTLVFTLVLALNLLLGLEANERRRRALSRRGFIEEGPFVGEDLQEAELKYFYLYGERARTDAA